MPLDTGINDQSLAIMSYELQVDEGFGSGFVPLTDYGYTGLTFRHRNLILGHKYTYRVKAANLMGYGVLSDKFSFIPRNVPSKPPKAPRNLPLMTTRSVIHIEYDTVKEDGGAAITDYHVYIDDGADGEFSGPYANGAVLRQWDSSGLNLETGKIYRLKYSSRNMHGESLLSDEV